MSKTRISTATKDRLNVVAIRIEHEGSIVARRVTLSGIAKPRRAVVSPTCLHGGRVEGVNFGTVPGGKRRMLLHAVWMKAVNPENREINTIANAIGPIVPRKLHHSTEAKCAQSRIIKDGRTGNVRDSDAGMIDHCGILRTSTGCRLFSSNYSGTRSLPSALVKPQHTKAIQRKLPEDPATKSPPITTGMHAK
jgi:hypothetical protein